MTSVLNNNLYLPNQIDWNMVANCIYNQQSDHVTKEEWIESEKDAMQNRLNLMRDLNLEEFKTNYWHFKRSFAGSDNAEIIYIVFSPIEITLKINSKSIAKIEPQSNLELQYLQALAIEYTNIKNYNKLKIVTKRLSHIIGEYR